MCWFDIQIRLGQSKTEFLSTTESSCLTTLINRGNDRAEIIQTTPRASRSGDRVLDIMLAWIRNLVPSFTTQPKMLHHSNSHPHPRPDNDDNFIMIDQDDNTTRPITPTEITETPKRESPVPKPLFTSPTDTTDALSESCPQDLIYEQDIMDDSHKNPMNKLLDDKINDTIFAWSWADTANTHATAADLNGGRPVVSPESPLADADRGSPMDIDQKPNRNYLPMTRAFGIMNTWIGNNNGAFDVSKTEKTKLDTISEEDSQPMDISPKPSQSTSPNLDLAAPVNSPTDSALGAPITALNSRTMQLSIFQLNQDDSYHTTPSGTAPPSYQTSPHLLPEFSQEAIQFIQPPSVLDDILEESTTLTESASTITLTQDHFSTMEEKNVKMITLPPNPRPWGRNEPTTFLCLPQRLRQKILIDTVSIKAFHVQRLRVIVVDENYKPSVKSRYKWGPLSWSRGQGDDNDETEDNGGILEDYYQAFVFDDKVKAWGAVLERVDENLTGDMKAVRRGWKRLGLVARKEKIEEMGWRKMEGSG